MVVHLLTGILAVVLLVVFLGYYALSISSLPLTIIIVLVLGAAAWDLYNTLRKRGAGEKPDATHRPSGGL